MDHSHVICQNGQLAQITRREFLYAGFGWFPFFRRNARTLAGIRFNVRRRGHGTRRYLLIHGNEETARQALQAHMKNGARGMAYLVSGHERNVRIAGAALDPNRMFSRAGAERNLRRLNSTLSDAELRRLLELLDRTRGELVRAVTPPRRGLLIATHNNREGYSMLDEIPSSDETALNDRAHPHDFILSTNAADFRALARSPYNALLQMQTEPDDGSLSRLAARCGVRYVNIEVGLGNFAKQTAMLGWVDRNLPE